MEEKPLSTIARDYALVDQRGLYPPFPGTETDAFRHRHYLPDGKPNMDTYPALGFSKRGFYGPMLQKHWIEDLLKNRVPFHGDDGARREILQHLAPIQEAAGDAFLHAMEGSRSQMQSDIRLPSTGVEWMKEVTPRLPLVGALLAEKLRAIPTLSEPTVAVLMEHWPAQQERLEAETEKLVDHSTDRIRGLAQARILRRLGEGKSLLSEAPGKTR